MKIKKIASLCAKTKVFSLFDVPDAHEHITQWLGDSNATYQLDGLPRMCEDNIFAMFDVTEKQRATFLFQHNQAPAEICFSDYDPTEQPIEDSNLCIVYGGTTLTPLETRNGIIFIQTKYLTPVEDALDVICLFERHTFDGNTYIAVKTGFLLVAIIFPYDIIDTQFVDRIHTLHMQCKKALHQKETARSREESEPPPYQVDETTGELLET